jgi:hypothetical protein
MAITLEKVLTLPEFQECFILSGENNLDRPVYRVSVIELPLKAEDHDKFGRPGDFNLTGLYAYRDQPEKLIELVSFLVQEESAGLCFIDSYFKTFPEKVIKYAQQNGFPIIRISDMVPYANIITGIMEMIIRNQEDAMLELRFKSLMDSTLVPSDIRSIVYGINESFKENTVALMIRQKKGFESAPADFWKMKLGKPEYSASTYNENLLVILTFSKNNTAQVRKMVDVVVSRILESQTILNVGVSSGHVSLDEIRQSMQEASQALEAACLTNARVVNYEEIGILKFLIPLRTHDASRNFAISVVKNLEAYDKKHNALLKDTAIQYIACHCDVKKTAAQMAVHENTIRYRIERMRDLFEGYDSLAEFNEMIAIALKLYRLIK